jgi:hypothetical protein
MTTKPGLTVFARFVKWLEIIMTETVWISVIVHRQLSRFG